MTHVTLRQIQRQLDALVLASRLRDPETIVPAALALVARYTLCRNSNPLPPPVRPARGRVHEDEPAQG